jgi:cytochrome c oxidase subunit IV
MNTIQLILAILAVMAFCLDAFGVQAKVKWTPLGFALVTTAVLIA